MKNVLAVFEQQIDHLECSQAERQMMLGNNAWDGI